MATLLEEKPINMDHEVATIGVTYEDSSDGRSRLCGGHLCEALTSEGYSVIALDNMSNADINNVRDLLHKQNFRLAVGDIRDIELLRRITRNGDAVFHLAAQIHIDRSIIHPETTFEVNALELYVC